MKKFHSIVCAVRGNAVPVNENFQPLPMVYTGCGSANVQRCQAVPGFQASASASARHIALLHFVVRSKEDFAIKMARRGGNGGQKTWEFFNAINRCCIDVDLDHHLKRFLLPVRKLSVLRMSFP